MLTRPFTRLIVAFGIRKITQRRLAEEFVTGILILIPFGIIIGFVTSRICTKIHFSTTSSSICFFFNIRSDVWTTIVVFLIGDILMEWLLPSLGCLPIPAGERMIATGIVGLSSTTAGSSSSSAAAVAAKAMVAMMTDDGDNNGDIDTDDDYVTNILNGIENENNYIESTYYQEDEYHYTMRWVLQSYGLYCPINFANSNSLLTPDATAILFSIRLLFLCIGVHIGESCGSFVALTGGIATGKSTAAQMFVNYNNNDNNDNNENEDDNENEDENNNNNSATATAGGSSNNSNNSWWYWWGRNNAFFSTAFLFSDDGYNEGTVQLICADSIAHSILLPPEMLVAGASKNSRQGENKQHSGNDSSEEEDNDYNDDDDNDENNTSNDDDDEGGNNSPNDINFVSPKDSVYYKILKAFEGKDILKEESTNGNGNGNNQHQHQRHQQSKNNYNKEIDRLKLGAIIFNDRTERKKLNSITHSKILSVLLRKLLRSVFFGVTDITIADLPLLFESGKLSWLFGITICITVSDPIIQLDRLQRRNPELPQRECQARIDSQMSLKKKQKMADIIIINDGDLEELREQVEDVRKDIMGRLYGIGMSLLQMLLLIGGSTSIAVSSKFYTHWQ